MTDAEAEAAVQWQATNRAERYREITISNARAHILRRRISAHGLHVECGTPTWCLKRVAELVTEGGATREELTGGVADRDSVGK